MATISLPSTIFSDTHLPDGKETVGVFFTLYEVPHLFPVSMDNVDSERTREVGSFILGATVGRGVDITDIDPPVLVKLMLQNPQNVSTNYGL